MIDGAVKLDPEALRWPTLRLPFSAPRSAARVRRHRRPPHGRRRRHRGRAGAPPGRLEPGRPRFARGHPGAPVRGRRGPGSIVPRPARRRPGERGRRARRRAPQVRPALDDVRAGVGHGPGAPARRRDGRRAAVHAHRAAWRVRGARRRRGSDRPRDGGRRGGRDRRRGAGRRAGRASWGRTRGPSRCRAARGRFVFDAATSLLAEGKVRVARAAGKPLPPDAIVDKDGRPSRDPEAFYAGGALLPLGGAAGGHKGYGLGLASALLGGLGMIGDTDPTLVGAAPPEGEDARGRMAGVFLQAIDPAAFGDAARYGELVDEALAAAKRQPPADGVAEVLVPGSRRLARGPGGAARASRCRRRRGRSWARWRRGSGCRCRRPGRAPDGRRARARPGLSPGRGSGSRCRPASRRTRARSGGSARPRRT